MLSPDALGRLEQLQLSARHRLAGQIAGAHRSPQYGDTLDFADFREYNPGDDYRRIDTNVLARLDVLRVKLFEAEDDLVVRVLLDTSASMGMYGKLEAARSLVAALAAVTLSSNDAFVIAPHPSGGPPRRFHGRRALPEVVHHLEAISSGGGTPFVEAAGRMLALPGPPGLTVVVSDLLTPDWHRAVVRMRARRSDLLVVHLLAPDETDPELIGDLSLVDEETAEQLPVSLSDDRVAEYRDRVRRWRVAVARHCSHVGGRYLPLDSTADLEATLMASWRAAGVFR